MNERSDTVTHAGGVVFRQRDGVKEFALIRARKVPNAWVFPKGHIEAGETAEQAARREVLEEAGVHAEIVQELGELRTASERTAMFLMASIQSSVQPAEREVVWLGFDAALERVTFEESKKLLRDAEAALRSAEKQ